MSESARLDAILSAPAGDGDVAFILARRIRYLEIAVADTERQLKSAMELLRQKDRLVTRQQETIDGLIDELRATREKLTFALDEED